MAVNPAVVVDTIYAEIPMVTTPVIILIAPIYCNSVNVSISNSTSLYKGFVCSGFSDVSV